MKEQIVYLDSSAIVKRYLNEVGTDIVDQLFKRAEIRENILYFSIWNVGEVIGVFDRYNRVKKGKALIGLIDDFVNELSRLSNIGSVETVGITLPIIFESVNIVVKYKIYIADALQIVSCKNAACDEFITADKNLYNVALKEGLKSILL